MKKIPVFSLCFPLKPQQLLPLHLAGKSQAELALGPKLPLDVKSLPNQARHQLPLNWAASCVPTLRTHPTSTAQFLGAAPRSRRRPLRTEAHQRRRSRSARPGPREKLGPKRMDPTGWVEKTEKPTKGGFGFRASGFGLRVSGLGV